MNKAIVTINGGKIQAEVASSIFTRFLGLSYRKLIKGNEGMIFIFPLASRPIYWNFGMFFPIDVLWIRDSRVIGIEENVPAMKNGIRIFCPENKADSALEFVAGSAKRLGVEICDKIDVSFIQ